MILSLLAMLHVNKLSKEEELTQGLDRDSAREEDSNSLGGLSNVLEQGGSLAVCAWDHTRLPEDVIFDADAIVDKHPEGAVYLRVPSQLNAEQRLCFTKNRLFTSRVCNRTEALSTILDRYGGCMSRMCCYAAMLHEPDHPRGLSPSYLETTMSGKPGLFFKDTNRLWTTYSLRGVPTILPTPVAAVRFRKEQLGEGMPN
jgi:hypothetical protein